MIARTQKARLLTSTLAAGWVVLIWSEQVATNTWLAALLFLVLYALTLYATHRYDTRTLPLLIRLAFGTIAAGVIFTFWGTLLDRLFLPSFIPTTAKAQRISLLLFNGALVAAITGLIVGYPLRRLFIRFWWLPIIAAACAAAVLMFPSLRTLRIPELSTWGAIVTATDLAFLCTLAPLVAFMAYRAAANNSFKPKPLRGSA